MTPAAHSTLAASSASRWLHCPASVQLTKDLPDTDSPYAAAGTLAHALAELKLRKQYLEPMGPRAYSTRLKKLQANPAYAPEMSGNTDAYTDYIADLVLAFPARPHVVVEQRVDYSVFAPGGFGTADCLIFSSDVLHVVDYKNGAGVPVSAEDNPQLKLYALGALLQYQAFYSPQKVVLHVFQPNAGGAKSWETTRDDLVNWGTDVVLPAAKQALSGDGPQAPGEWCRFCKIRGNCRARGEALALEAFGQRPAATYTDDEIGGILTRARTLAAWVKDLEDYALTKSLHGEPIPGYKAVHGRSVRAFTDQDKAFAALIAAGVDAALLYKRTPLTLAQAEKLMPKNDFAATVGEYITKQPGKPALVPESDPRPAVSAAQEAFGTKTTDNNTNKNLED